MNPLTLQIPEQVESERLLIRATRPDDAQEVNAAVNESFAELHQWMPWAQTPQTLEQSREHCRESYEHYLTRKSLGMQMRRKTDDILVGMMGFHSIEWDVPKFEIGYWVRTQYVGQGYVTEAVNRLTQLAFENYGAMRVEIRMDNCNERSWRVAERAGYHLDAILRNDERTPLGELRDTRIYSKIRLPDGTIY